jgi:branched-chain amino acid transport system substrate-binding protein
MNRSRGALVLMSAIGLLAAACHGRPSRVVFGIGMSSNTHDAVTLAATEINAQGGIGGVPLELMGSEEWAQPNQFDPAITLAWANRFIANKDVLGVIGHSDSASTLSAAALYNRSGLPHLVTIATNPAITGIGPWTYRLCLSDAAQGPALAEYAVNDWKKRHIAIFFVNDDYGRGLSQRFETRARELGAEIVTSVTHRNALQDDDKVMIRAALGHLKAGPHADLVALFQRVDAAEWTVQAIHDAGLDVDKLGGDTLAQYRFAAFSPALTDGVRVSQFFSLDPANPRAVQFSKDFHAVAGIEPDYARPSPTTPCICCATRCFAAATHEPAYGRTSMASSPRPRRSRGWLDRTPWHHTTTPGAHSTLLKSVTRDFTS